MRPSNPIEEMQVYALNSNYLQPPTPAQIKAGVVPLDTLPADWWNKLLQDITVNLNNAGLGMQSVYDEVLNVLQAAGITPSSTSSSQLLASIQKLARAIATTTMAGAVVSSTASGKVSVDQDGVMTPNGLGVPSSLNTLSRNVVDAINEILTTLTNHIQTANATISALENGKAPTNHTSNQTTYGAGSASNYGHVKLSDALDSALGAADGVAATPAAVKCLQDQITGMGGASITDVYPVGTVYINAKTTIMPASIAAAGIWCPLNAKFLRATTNQSCVGCAGGNDTVTLAASNLPNHSHSGSVGGHSHSFSGDGWTGTMNQCASGSIVFCGNPYGYYCCTLPYAMFVFDGCAYGYSCNACAEAHGSGNMSPMKLACGQGFTYSCDVNNNRMENRCGCVEPVCANKYAYGFSINVNHQHYYSFSGNTGSCTPSFTGGGQCGTTGQAFDIKPAYTNVAMWYRDS